METTGVSTDPDKIASDTVEETVDLTTTPTGPSMEATERSINTQHRPGNPKNNILFEYAAGKGDQELYRVLHRMIDFLKGMSVNDRQKFKEFRKYSPRTVNEISEDQIATVAINEICDALHSDVDLVYDALVASDYIKEISEA